MPNILHFTDVDNLRGILDATCLRCHRDAPTAVEVGDVGIKANRQRRQVGCGPGGTVGDYVPFYFAPRSPMMFKIGKGGVDGVSDDLSRLIYFGSTTEAVWEAGLPCIFSDGNAAVLITKFCEDPSMLDTHVDFPLMKQTMWASTLDDPDRMRRRMAEFLVHERLPLEMVGGIVVKNARMRASVESVTAEMGMEIAVAIRPGWYF